MVTIISGSRRIIDPLVVEEAVRASGFTITMVIEGGQRTYNNDHQPIGGIDYLAMRWARENRIMHRRVKARWDLHGRAAGPIRNREMARLATQLIAIPDSESKGTVDMIRAAQDAGYTSARIYVHSYRP